MNNIEVVCGKPVVIFHLIICNGGTSCFDAVNARDLQSIKIGGKTFFSPLFILVKLKKKKKKSGM